jgi:tRNA nucleotidyltransferase/poly(A) polymerase
VEVATFRCESGYADGRHPDRVKFATPEEDASRRDFTINGMFYDPVKRQVIDYIGGQADLEKHIIRTIGNPAERFGEDYLRMLRAVRFSTQLGFGIEHATFAAICTNAAKITGISGERIAVELEGILVSPNRAKGASMLIETGLAEAIFPGLTGDPARFGVSVLGQLRKKSDFALTVACFLAGCETQFAMDRLQILKLSRNQNKHIRFLLTNRGKLLNDKMSLAELKKLLAEPYFRDLYELQRAIQKIKGPAGRGIQPLVNLRRRIRALGDIELKPKPILNGHDLIRLGVVPGPSLGQLAEELYISQLEGELHTIEQAQQWAKAWLSRHTTHQ